MTLGIGGLCLLGAGSLHGQSLHSENLSLEETRAFFDLAFSVPREQARDLRRWDGGEHFCFVWRDPNTPLRRFAPAAIAQISEAYELNFTASDVLLLSECDRDLTNIYVMVGAYPGTPELGAMLHDISGTPPPRDFVGADPVLGFSITMPGPRNRDFIFVATKDDPRMPRHIDSRAIFLEELLHSLLGASDVNTMTSISQLAEVETDGEYINWYKQNPRGWCTIDFLFLELVLGRIGDVGNRFDELRAYLSNNYTELVSQSAQKRRSLTALADARC